jgi:hypothetical protein
VQNANIGLRSDDLPSYERRNQPWGSCLFLIALARYPDAFVACVFSIESALKAALPQSSKEKLQKILNLARRQIVALQTFDATDLDALRSARNRIVHEGFKSEDHRAATKLLLKTALPFLAECHKRFFNFSIFDGLEESFGTQLRVAGKLSTAYRLRTIWILLCASVRSGIWDVGH